MSADNWAVCPRCKYRHEKEAERLHAEAEAAYGVLPANDWMAKNRAAVIASEPLATTTFREDYEIFGAEEGCIEVSYAGGCSVCGLKVDFKHSVEIEGVRP